MPNPTRTDPEAGDLLLLDLLAEGDSPAEASAEERWWLIAAALVRSECSRTLAVRTALVEWC